jgi:hypothetical protein
MEAKLTKPKRVVTNEDIKKYEWMVDSFIHRHVVKNFNEARNNPKTRDHVMLGNSGMTLGDIRQHLLTEMVIALQNYNPEVIGGPTGRPVLESSFLHTHLTFRVGALMKKVTSKARAFGVWHSQIEKVQFEIEE